MQQLARNVGKAFREYQRGVILLNQAMYIIELYLPSDTPGVRSLKDAVKNFDSDLQQTILETSGGNTHG